MVVKAHQTDQSKGIVYHLFVAKSDSADAVPFPIYVSQLMLRNGGASAAVKFSLYGPEEHSRTHPALPSFNTLDELVDNYKQHRWDRKRPLTSVIHGSGGPDLGTLVMNADGKTGVITGVIVRTRVRSLADAHKTVSSTENKMQLLLENAGMEHINGAYQVFSVPGQAAGCSYRHTEHSGIVLAKAGDEWVVRDSSTGMDLYSAAAISTTGDEVPLDGWVQTPIGVYPPPRLTLQLIADTAQGIIKAGEAFDTPVFEAPVEGYEAVVCYADMNDTQDARIQVKYDRRSNELGFGRLIPGNIRAASPESMYVRVRACACAWFVSAGYTSCRTICSNTFVYLTLSSCFPYRLRDTDH